MSRRIGLLLVMLFLLAGSCFAQDTATIVGTVTDPSGAVVPGAKITVSNPQRGYVLKLATNSKGNYAAQRIPIGNYIVTVESAGFKRVVQTGIHLTVGQTQRVNIMMTIGGVTQAVTVAGNLPHVQTENATLSNVITSKQIQNLALNGNNFLGLTFLVPGAVISNGQQDAMQLGHNGSEVSVSFNGAPTAFSQLDYDGGNDSQESSTNMGGGVTPALDSIAEFRISTSNYGADVGQHSGALVEIVTKGGTRHFHGDLYEYVRNDKMDANDFFANTQINPPGGNAPKTPLKWNIFGGTLGGPFYIPGLYNTKKNKTFFFYSEEFARYRSSNLINSSVPTLAERQGDFSQCDPNSPSYLGNVDPSFSPAGGCQLPVVNGQPVDKVTPVNSDATDWLNTFVPLPNNGYNGYIHAASAPTNFSDTVIRVDQNINDKASMFVRFSNDEWNSIVVPSLWFGGNYDTTQSDYVVPARQGVLHLNYNFKSNLMDEFSVSYTNTPHWVYPQPGPANTVNSVDRPSNWDASMIFPANESNPLIPSVSICGNVPFCFSQDNGPFQGKYDSEPVLSWRDNLAWVKGNHTIKTGFDLENFALDEQFVIWGVWTQGYYSFSPGHPGSTGNALADAFLGDIGSYTEATVNNNGNYVGGYAWGHWRQTDFEPYIQDDWKVNNRLTLNFGVRYYMITPQRDVTNPTVDSSFLPNLYNPAAAAVLLPNDTLSANPATNQIYDFSRYGNGLVECGTAPNPPGCATMNFHQIAPRFSFAWDPTGKGTTSIRGGFGVYYESSGGNSTLQLEGNPPTQMAPIMYNLTTYNFNASSTGFAPFGPGGVGAVSPNQINPTIDQYNLNVEHQFKGNNLVTVAYVGNIGRHLTLAQNFNQVPVGVGMQTVPALAGNNQYCSASGVCDVQNILMHNILPADFFRPYQGYGSIMGLEPQANSNYNALQATFRHNAGHGLTLLASYTYSHSLTNLSNGVDQNYDLARWYGTSNMNRTQVFTASYIYALPFFAHSHNSFFRQSLGGWQISGITTVFSGMPMTMGCGISGYSSGIGQGVQCNTTGPVQTIKGVYDNPVYGPQKQWFNLSNVTEPLQSQLLANGQPGMFGYMGMNTLYGPGRDNWDLALYKNFSLPWLGAEHSTLQFRFDTFNTFNHTQYNGVSVGCNGSSLNADSSEPFGRSCGGATYNPGNGTVDSTWAPREIQLGMKLIF